MKISIHGWKHRIEQALDLLPEEMRSELLVTFDRLGPISCEKCGTTWLRVTINGAKCDRCAEVDLGSTLPVDFSVACDRVVIARSKQVVASAVVVNRNKGREIVVPGTHFRSYRFNSTKAENSVESLQACIRSLVFPHFGLTSDRDGFWGWPRGERLEGGDMVPDIIQVLDMLEEQAEHEDVEQRAATVKR